MPAGTETGKMAFAFPGVGVNLREEEAAFFRRHRAVMALFLEEASDHAGADLARALEEGKVAGLDERERELFTYAFNCAAAAVFTGRGLSPSCTAGHSLGVYSALSASGAVSFGDGLGIVEQARSLVRETCDNGCFGMGVVIGLAADEVEEIFQWPDLGSLAVANINSEVSMVISGLRGELEVFLAEAEMQGAVKAILLDIDMPYHHPGYLARTQEPFETFLRGLSWNRAACPIISTLDRVGILTSPEELIDFTSRNLSTPIRWQRVVEAMSRLGVREVIECGPGISLTQNAHFIGGAPHHLNLRSSLRRLGI